MPTKPAGAFKPGALAPASGFVQIPGAEGEKTVIKGKRFPPTSKPGQAYIYTAVPIHGSTRALAPRPETLPREADRSIDRAAA